MANEWGESGWGEHPYVACRKCGEMFEQDEPWKKICLDCWKESKGLGGRRSSWQVSNPLQAELDRALEDLQAARSRIQQLQGELRRVKPGMDAEMLGRLIRLCHPDKHGDSEAATVATQWLLKQRN